MTASRRGLLAAALSALLPIVGWAQETAKPAGPKYILWSRTWESAQREASVRNVPIYILVSIGEG